jgi:hypothetical protein
MTYIIPLNDNSIRTTSTIRYLSSRLPMNGTIANVNAASRYTWADRWTSDPKIPNAPV